MHLLQPGSEISHYRILDEIGRGGMGVVYRAEDTKLKRTVALKMLSTHMLGSEADRSRFYREARAAAGLHHPNIGTVFEIDESDDNVFIALEFIDGQTLSDLIEEGPLPLESVISIAVQVADGLGLAHEHHVTHRDMKSGNVMLTKKGTVKILDFGLAKTAASTKLTQMGSTLGTIAYMSPEQARGEEVDHRSDLWSLGVVLYEMISGKLPFPGDYEQAVIYGILNEHPRPLTAVRTGVPIDLERIVEKCLRKDCELRYQHADDLAADLKAVNVKDPPPMLPPQASESRRSATTFRTWPVVTALALALLGGVVLGHLVATDKSDVSRAVVSMFRVTFAEDLELDPVVSPDGTMIAYVGGVARNTELFVKHVEGGNRLSVAPAAAGWVSGPAWSPDGSRIAFQQGRSIYLVPALGGTPEPLLLAPPGSEYGYHSVAWSPDGERIATVSRDSLVLVDLETRDRVSYAGPLEMRALVWSPDGSKLAGSAGNFGWDDIHGSFANISVSNVWTFDVEKGRFTDVTGSKSQNDSPAWDGTGDGLYFVSGRGGGMDIYHVGLTETGSADGEPERVTVGLGAHTIASDRTGSRIAVAKVSLRRNVWRIPIQRGRTVSTREAEQVTFGNHLVEAMDISSDGTRLVYDSNIRGSQDIYLQTIGDSQPVQLTDNDANDFVSTWIDDKTVLFYSMRQGERDVYTLNTDTREVKLIVDDPMQAQHPDLSRDRRKMIFRAFDPDREGLAVLDKMEDGSWGNRRQFEGRVRVARWSPTDDRVAYVGTAGLLLFDTESGADTLLVSSERFDVSYVRWSKDGSNLYFLASQGGEHFGIWIISSHGGEPEQLVKFDEPDKVFGFLYVASDDVYLYFTLKEAESDVWMLEVGSPW